MVMTPEQIAKETEGLTGEKSRRAIRKIYRNQDDSNLWPIRGRFNCTNRAIRKAQKFINESGEDLDGLEYALLIDSIMSEIVNNPRNW
jgi:hypothetical protein